MKLTDSAEQFLIKTLGQEGLEELQKFELWKINSNKVIDHEEIKTGMQIVPRTVLTFLHKEFSDLTSGQAREVKLPVDPAAFLSVTKFDSDLYSGEIRQQGKILARFKDRSLPGIGLVVMSTFELYDINALAIAEPPKANLEADKVQQIIDERIGLRDLVRQVVDQRLTEREAISEMIRIRLTQAMREAAEAKQSSPKESFKLKNFLEQRSKKKPEFKVLMEKNETVSCNDCGQDIFIKGAFSGCVCYGDDRNNKIFIKKNQQGITMRFPKSWDIENIQMLLETLRNKNRGN